MRKPSPAHLPILYLYMSVLMTAHSKPRQRSFAAVNTDRLALFILNCLINLTPAGGIPHERGYCSPSHTHLSLSLLALIVYFLHHIPPTLQTDPVGSPTSFSTNRDRPGCFSVWCWRGNLIHMQLPRSSFVCDSFLMRTDSLKAVWPVCATCLFGLQNKINARKH